ncbi:hypothetical protein HMI54_012922 [Coelomomyces lativittatus]|nr:hypothetical protein HMI54_012922 [Coelomomyces lativittatus]
MAPSPFFYPTSPLSSTCHRIHLDSIQDGHSSLTLCLSITPTVLHLKRPRSKLTFHRLLPCTPSLPLDDPSFVSNFPRSFINEWKDLLNTNKNNVDWYFKDPIKLHRPLCDLMHGGSPEAWVQPVSFQQLKLNSSEVASASFTFVSIQKKDLSLLFNSSPTCTKGSEGLS